MASDNGFSAGRLDEFETGVALEVHGLPARLDLSGAHVRAVVAAGARIVPWMLGAHACMHSSSTAGPPPNAARRWIG
jgi:hypothetical protein